MSDWKSTEGVNRSWAGGDNGSRGEPELTWNDDFDPYCVLRPWIVHDMDKYQLVGINEFFCSGK